VREGGTRIRESKKTSFETSTGDVHLP